MRRPSFRTLTSFLVVMSCSAFVVLQLEPALLFSNTTPNGGDMGAHVWTPAFLRDHLLPQGRISGWAPDAWAGFPALTFYFPLPSLLIVLLDLLLPYNLAFKIVTVLGLATLPIAAYAFGRLSGLRFPGPPTLAAATLPFLFDTSFTIYGGNIPSTLAGEFAFSLSLSLALVFLGVVARGLDDGRRRSLAAILFALTGLSHLLPALFAAAAAMVLLLLHLDRRRFWYLASVGLIGTALMGFWLVPLVVRLPYTNDLGWAKVTEYLQALFPPHLRWVVILAVVGGIASWGLRLRAGMIVLAISVATGLMFVVAPESRIWNARFLPFWFLSVYLLAGVGASELGRAAAGAVARNPNRPSQWVTAATPVAVLAYVLVAVGGPLRALPAFLPVRPGTVSFVGDWVRWNYSGYEAKPAYPEYAALMTTMGSLPCGRAMWEYGPELDRYGTPMALMLLPYWTKGCIASMEGLFFESSPTVPFHFLNQSELSKTPSRPQRDLPYRDLDVDRGVEHLQLWGVRYYMAFSPEALDKAAGHPDLRPVATSPPWEIFEVRGSDVAQGLSLEPVVVTGIPGGAAAWLERSIPFYQDSLRWDVFPAAGGPPGWARVQGSSPLPRRAVPAARVSGIVIGEDRISFEVDRIGSPVLVKISYFPNWKARGAEGPWRVAPNLMVVVPTQRRVEMTYGYTPVEGAGWALSLLGLIAAAALSRRPVRYPHPPPGIEMFRRFAAITVAVTIIDIGVLLLLRLQLGASLVAADLVAIALAATASYLLHRSITFGDDPHVRWVREPLTFAVVAAVSGGVDLIALIAAASLLESTGAGLVGAKLIALAAAGTVRVVAYRTRLFMAVRSEQKTPSPVRPAPGAIRLSVVVPVYNSASSIARTIATIRSGLAPVSENGGLELLVIDDGSSDDTAERARVAGADGVVALDSNRGKGAAVRAGVLAARGRVIAFTDADLSYDPRQILSLLEEVERGWDVVVGSRKHVRTTTLVRAGRLREATGRFFNLLTRAVLLGQYRDTQCGIKAFRSDVARLLFSKSRLERFAFDVEIFHLAERYRLSLEEVPVTVSHTESSTLRLGLDAIRMVRDVFKVRRWAGEGIYDLRGDEASEFGVDVPVAPSDPVEAPGD